MKTRASEDTSRRRSSISRRFAGEAYRKTSSDRRRSLRFELLEARRVLAAALDYGDALDLTALRDIGDYQTLAENDDPRHELSPYLYLGSLVDGEGNAQPDARASGDNRAEIPSIDQATRMASVIHSRI